ncbi:MAG: hypothetical protein IPK50_21830 [Fibrobacterota bacterium]|nr:hypothetical protein [Fibrobacterota bacterium]QQS04888.1 MAG: hypothetical protein IPK50_21830 [Fibrobacterota bacterium]
MNRLEGRIEEIKGAGAVRLARVRTIAGHMNALVLDVGSPTRPMAVGKAVRLLFKETALVVAAPHHPALEGVVKFLHRGEVVADLEVALGEMSTIKGRLPSEEIPTNLMVGSLVRIHVPASALALEIL